MGEVCESMCCWDTAAFLHLFASFIPQKEDLSANSIVDKTFGKKNDDSAFVRTQRVTTTCVAEKTPNSRQFCQDALVFAQVSALGLETLSDPEAFLSFLD